MEFGFSNQAGFWTGNRSQIFGSLNGPKPLQLIQTGGARSPPPFWMGFETVEGRLDSKHRRFPVQKPAGFESPTIPFPDLSNAWRLVSAADTWQLHGVPRMHRSIRTVVLAAVKQSGHNLIAASFELGHCF